MHRDRILLAVAVITGLVPPVGAFAFSGGPAMAAPSSPAPMAYTCTGGDFASGNLTSIPSGTYASITVTGACAVAPRAVITVIGSVNVASGAVLDAQSAPSTITVGHNVTAAAGSLLGLGCLPNPTGHTTGHRCAVDHHRHSTITVDGNIIAWDANTVLLNGITVNGSVALIGGGEQAGNPWPIKTNTIGGNLIVFGATPEWLGVVINKIGGNVILGNITVAPGETMDVANNTIGSNLVCWKLAPAVSGGFPGEVNVVGGRAIGQCPLDG
jgi:hypothetical protein